MGTRVGGKEGPWGRQVMGAALEEGVRIGFVPNLYIVCVYANDKSYNLTQNYQSPKIAAAHPAPSGNGTA